MHKHIFSIGNQNETETSGKQETKLPAPTARRQVCLNGIWDFQSAADCKWTRIRVPGCYAGVLKSWGGVQWDCFDYPSKWEGKAAVYRRTFTVPPEMENLDIRFACNACAHHTEVLLNNARIGEWHDGYTPFEFPLNKALVKGENTLELRVSDRPNDLFDDFGTHRRGIWQDTFLKARPWVAVGNDLFIRTSFEQEKIACEIPIENNGTAEVLVEIEGVVTEKDGTAVKSFTDRQTHRLAPGTEKTVQLAEKWAAPRLWFPHDPHLYYFHVILRDKQGRIIDHYRHRFGFREITWQGPHLYLNGRELFLRGHSGHYSGDIKGSRAYMETWLRNLLARGINFMRLHDSPKHRELYEVADELGIMLEAEAVCHFRVPADPAIWQGHLEGLIKAQRNHPSIIVWSVSNELRWRGGGEKPEMIEYARRYDTTRPVFASDFSLESRHGDICGHHYAPITVFEDWEKYGPDKPMLWDELGSVWAHDRPLDNGTSGYEAQAQDYATGLWHDGHDQILRDIILHHEGKVFAGELHRINGFIPWDLSYNFFRWQPINNNQPLELRHDDLGGPGIKQKHVRPCASPVNPWDPTLPEFEPNPGFALFAKYMKPVRFFDDRDERTFFAESEWSCRSRVFYDDLRPADELACRVETMEGEVMSETVQSLNLIPGNVIDEVTCRFSFPSVEFIKPAKLVREFRYQGNPGCREEQSVKIFPRLRLSELRFKALDGTDTSLLKQAGLKITKVKEISEDRDILLINENALDRPDVRAWLEKGGKALCLTGKNVRDKCKSRITDRFTDACGRLTPDRGLTSAEGCNWYGWTPSEEVRIMQVSMMSAETGYYGQLTFDNITEPGAYAFALFDKPLSHLEEGSVSLRYQSRPENMEQLAIGGPRMFDRKVGLLVRDADGRWYLSAESCAFTLGRAGAPELTLTELDWQEVTNVSDGLIQGRIETGAGATPDLSMVTGAGVYHYRVPERPLEFRFSKFELTGRATAAALIPFNGPEHRLLDNIDQQDLSFWRGGAAAKILTLPEQCNYRVVLAGNKDGMGAALYERMIGNGAAVVTSLKLEDLKHEPAAHGMLANITAYLNGYQADQGSRTAVSVAPELEARLDEVGLLRRNDLKEADTIIIDNTCISQALTAGVSDRVKDGATLLLCGTDEQSLDDACRLSGRNLKLTEPYLHERKHCVKAAVSWTRRDTPPVPAEYFEGFMIPLPFEPNYDPVIAGLVNRDLDWDGLEMFRQGIEVDGMDPVKASQDYNILISNWRIDWRKPDWGGEYTHAPKDQKRADWFVNRDPVLLKVSYGEGAIIFCQLDLLASGEKPRRILTQLLTNLGCALGKPACFTHKEATFDFSSRTAQLSRFAEHYRYLAPARRRYYGIPEHRREEGDPMDIPVRAPTMMIGDFLTARVLPYVMNNLWETHEVNGPYESTGTTREGVTEIQRLDVDQYSIIHIGFGLEDLKLGPDGEPTVGLAEFKANLEEIVEHLKKTGAKLYWNTIAPLPKSARDYRPGDEVAYNAAAQTIMDKHGVYTVDLHIFIRESIPEIESGDRLDPTLEQISEISKVVAQAIEFFGAQQ